MSQVKNLEALLKVFQSDRRDYNRLEAVQVLIDRHFIAKGYLINAHSTFSINDT